MKTITTLLFCLLATLVSFSQVSYATVPTSDSVTASIDEVYSASTSMAPWAYYTPSRDSLFFDETDDMGIFTFNMWHNDPRGWNREFSPVITLVSHEQMLALKLRGIKESEEGER